MPASEAAAQPLRLYNTLTRQVEAFQPADPGRVTFYSCGPTVYDDAHIGNFRSFLAADTLRRWLESPWCLVSNRLGPREVVQVMNITDVGHMTDDAEGGETGEDRMAVAGRRLQEAKKAGKLPAGVEINPSDPHQIAKFYEARFREDAKRLGMRVAMDAERHASRMPRATENVDGMVALVDKLVKSGHAYVVGEPGSRVVYFRVKSFPDYGKLSGNTLEKLREGEGGRISSVNQSAKEHPADFLLWKEDSSHIMKWESPWGWGYPGWHIECTVMSVRGLIPRAAEQSSLGSLQAPGSAALIDLHSGGEDNIFPHHECEIAQTCCAFNAEPRGASFARTWFHPRFLMVEGEKMSKSKGNFYTLRDLIDKGHEPAAIRLQLVKTHYRSNLNFTLQGLKDDSRMLERWRKWIETAGGDARKRGGGVPSLALQADAAASPGAARARDEFIAAMSDDLNVAAAVAAINTMIGECPSPTPADAMILTAMDDVLGVLELEAPKHAQSDIGIFLSGLTPDPAVVAKLEERREARAAKNFKRSDEIRDELAAMGLAIKDVAGGKVEVSRR
ncbi:MAG: cysteine--tRNA ligase [Planctomycetota bacterium]|nr:cysteine--tRNA ligase [Planctomycetota bacterium]